MHRLRFIAPLVWAAFIFWLSHQPTLPKIPIDFDFMDKVMHAGVYGILAGLCFWALHAPTQRRAWLSLVLASLYGASDEFHQWFVPGRTPDVWDWVADSLGAAMLAGLALWWLRTKPTNSFAKGT